METVKVGIIGGGLMGREMASAIARWFVLVDYPIQVELTAVCDLNEDSLSWYHQIPSIKLLTTDYKKLLADPEIDVLYVALPHHLHERYYIEVLESGKDLLAEKPFGQDLASAQNIISVIKNSGCFVRCSSEMPFFPGPQRLIDYLKSDRLGDIIQIKAGFYHSSDMNPLKPINWKRQAKFCGEIGVMGDLGMHVLHIPLRMGWLPNRVYARLQKVITERPDGLGGWAESDTWNNASISALLSMGNENIPMDFEMKRLAPGETNSWWIEVLGTEGGVKYNTKDTKAIWFFDRQKEQSWHRIDLGFQTAFKTITGGIFEPGFPDCFMQMLAAFFAERQGSLNKKFGCVTPEEALMSHQIFSAALRSHRNQEVVVIDY